MRTTLDFPSELFVHLKTRAAIDGVTLRETVIGLLEKGLAAADLTPQAVVAPKKYYPPPSITWELDLPLDAQKSGKLWDLVWADDDAKAIALAKK